MGTADNVKKISKQIEEKTTFFKKWICLFVKVVLVLLITSGQNQINISIIFVIVEDNEN
jgi:hypothetical protein